jgi:predicted DNA-binding transcriptional regulator YafY
MSLRLERLLFIDAAIRAGTYPTISSLIERFEVSERTVRADLAFMRERLNAPLLYRCGSNYLFSQITWDTFELLH